eukprot:scaffold126248_cov63-Phaeocystis_antarctica.AAC.1
MPMPKVSPSGKGRLENAWSHVSYRCSLPYDSPTQKRRRARVAALARRLPSLSRMLGCMHALLLAGASTQLINVHGHTAQQWAEVNAKGQPTTAELTRQHAAPPQPDAASPAAPPDAGEPAVSSPALLPREVYESAGRGELQKVTKWLGKGGPVDALCPATTEDGSTATFGLLHAAARNGQLEMAGELLKRGASVDLPGSLGITALMAAAHRGHLSVVLLLLQHSANPDLQDDYDQTALMAAAHQGQEACVKALLRAGANTELLNDRGFTALQCAENQGHTAIAELIRQHAAPRQPTAAAPAAPPDASEATVSSPASLPLEIYESSQRGELQKVVKWLGKGGLVDALASDDGRTASFGLLHAAATNGHLEMARELLKRGASVDLPGSLGLTALMATAGIGHLSTLRLLLQHSANPDLQVTYGGNALMTAAYQGHEAC